MKLKGVKQKDLDALFWSMHNLYARLCNRYSSDMEIIGEEITMTAKQAAKFEKYGLMDFPEDLKVYEEKYKSNHK